MVTGDHPVTAEAIARKVGIISDTTETADKVSTQSIILHIEEFRITYMNYSIYFFNYQNQIEEAPLRLRT
jgi:magnesium-transporting ATPase (P-type)